MDIDEKEQKCESNNNNNNNTTSTKPQTVEYASFDLNKYAKRYTGKIKIDRLLHIANICPDLTATCYKLAATEVQSGIAVAIYDRVMETAQKILGPTTISFDAVWMSNQEQTNEKKVRYLEDEIQRWRNLSNRENICASYLAAAEYCVKIGNYNTAISRYIEAKSYAGMHTSSSVEGYAHTHSTTGDTKMLLDINLKIMMTSIQSGQFAHVKSEAAHALASEDIYKNHKFKSKILCCLGLYHLYNGRYDMAVQYFIDCNFSIHNDFSSIISTYDIAMYGGLCALATFNRKQLKHRILDNNEFKRFLELTPNILCLIQGFYDSEYNRVMSGLNLLKKDIMLDIYLCNRVEHLLTAIRGKALVQYFSPYSAMDIRKMAKAFNVPVDEMELELSTCIADNHIKAKIDSHNKIVYAETINKRAKVFRNVLKIGDEFNRDMKAVLLRSSLSKHRVVVAQMHENMFDVDEDGGGILSAMGMGGVVKNFGRMGGGRGGRTHRGGRKGGRGRSGR